MLHLAVLLLRVILEVDQGDDSIGGLFLRV